MTTKPKAFTLTLMALRWWWCLLGVLACSCFCNAVERENSAPPVSGTLDRESYALAPSADLTPIFERLGFDRREQGKRGTCSVFTVASALEFALARRDNPERLSVEFLNWAANQANGDSSDGGFFSHMWKGYIAHGICSESAMPYRDEFSLSNSPTASALVEAKSQLRATLRIHWIKEWDVNTGLTDIHLREIKKTLFEGWPVCAGLRWPRQAKWKSGVLQMCGPEAVFDGHSVLLVGYREDREQPGGGTFIFRNTSNGGRDGRMPYAYAKAYMNDAMWIQLNK